MTYTFKKDLRKNWDLPPVTENPFDSLENDDDQDIYISERSSVGSSNDLSETTTPIAKRLPTPTASTLISIPTFPRYSQNEFVDNSTSIATHQQQKDEKKTKKNDLRKVHFPQTNLLPERKSPEYGDNYFPCWYYYKSQNPAWILRQRQNQSHDTPDPPQQPAFTSLPMKPQQQPPRKTRQSHGPVVPPNHDKQRFDPFENNSSGSIHSNTRDDHRVPATKKPTSQQRRKTKNDHDWTDNYGQSVSNNRTSQDSNSLVITANAVARRQKNRPKLSDKSSLITDLDELNRSRHHPQNHIRSHNSPSIPSHQTQHYHHHHHNPLHVRRRPPSGSEVHVVDVALRKQDRSSYLQPMRDQFHSPLSSITNQTLHLPSIVNDHHHHYQPKVYSPRFPTEYYGTLARQTHGKTWDESLDSPRIYKPDPQTRFYDRYLHTIADKRLAA